MRSLPGKICPLSRIATPHLSFCVDKKCAWWNGTGEECSIRTLATDVNLKVLGREGIR